MHVTVQLGVKLEILGYTFLDPDRHLVFVMSFRKLAAIVKCGKKLQIPRVNS